LACALVALVFVGCGDDDSSSDDDGEADAGDDDSDDDDSDDDDSDDDDSDDDDSDDDDSDDDDSDDADSGGADASTSDGGDASSSSDSGSPDSGDVDGSPDSAGDTNDDSTDDDTANEDLVTTCAAADNRIDPTEVELDDGSIDELARSRTGGRGVETSRTTTHTRYVSAANGDDDGDGSADNPWQTLQHAADEVEPDTTVLVDDSGSYAPVEFFSGGEPDGFVVFAAADPDSPPLIEGGADVTDLVYISASYFVFQGFQVAHHQRDSLDDDTVGIRIESEDEDLEFVEVRNNVVFDIGPPDLEDNSCYYNGHGIIAYAEGTSISDLTIAGNELHDLYVGNSEVLVVNGNISNFCVASNYVHDVNNIAIDIIGYEVNENETASDGWVVDNVILDASNYWPYCSRGNCTYPRGDESSDGIYVDGGANIEIAYNIVGRTDHGIELQSENGELIRDVEVHDNLIFNSNYRHLTIGEVENSREYDNVEVDDEALANADLESCK
jgi:hypothetical protein